MAIISTTNLWLAYASYTVMQEIQEEFGDNLTEGSAKSHLEKYELCDFELRIRENKLNALQSDIVVL